MESMLSELVMGGGKLDPQYFPTKPPKIINKSRSHGDDAGPCCRRDRLKATGPLRGWLGNKWIIEKVPNLRSRYTEHSTGFGKMTGREEVDS